MPYWVFVPVVAAIWLVVLGIREFRRKDHAWGMIDIVIAVSLLLIPIPSHSVTIDLPSQQP
ncbi:hypothetical protein [Erythrobacter sp.]|uniref:hypothetical protein n=1 Tax=Erythrobacter sp. TaxID=1042 RepID=UPI0025CD8B0A|nr:hypothetical protein [Erythrobacter sp.]